MMRSILAVALAAVLAPPTILADDGAVPEEEEPFVSAFDLSIDKVGGLAHDGEILWATDRVAGKIRGLDPSTGEERASLTAPGPWPTGLAHDGELLWVADEQRSRLFAYDTKRSLVVREVEAPSHPLGLAFDGEHLWVTDGKRIHRVSREDGTTIVSFDAPPWPGGKARGSEQLGLAFMDGYLWVSDRKENAIYRVEPERGEVIDALPSPGPFPAGLAAAGGRLFLADRDRRSVDGLEVASLPRVVRHDPRHEVTVFRRRIVNRGPDTVAEAHVYVAIPVSSASQALEGEPAFTPEPEEYVEDAFGQRFAHYVARNLRPGKSLDVEMRVRATLFAVRYHIDPARVGSAKSIPAEIRRKYLADGSKYAIRHPSIARHLEAALEGETRPYWMVRRIARYIGENMEYELAGGWNIAPTVIDRGTGSCSEYTFVFISMCRAAGIPARYVGSVVVRGDDASTDDVFHRWAEVYFPGYGWVPADAQAADKPTPAKQGAGIGTLVNRFLITTRGGGASEQLGWEYNSSARWKCRGRCEVEDLHLGDWYPVERGPLQTP